MLINERGLITRAWEEHHRKGERFAAVGGYNAQAARDRWQQNPFAQNYISKETSMDRLKNLPKDASVDELVELKA